MAAYALTMQIVCVGEQTHHLTRTLTGKASNLDTYWLIVSYAV